MSDRVGTTALTEATYADPVNDDASRPSAWVAIFSGTERRVTELRQSSVVTVGRSRSSEILVDDPRVSRLHLSLEWDGSDQVRVTDHDSRHGTLVGRVRLRGCTAVPSGTALRVANTDLIIRIQTGESTSDPKPTPTGDEAMRRTYRLADKAAESTVTALILGETGVGKEVIARYIHERSARSQRPLIAVNCGSIAESLAESMLFGHERGAFTGASERRIGYFEAAHGGTLFLDEVGELSAGMQARLLRAIDEQAICRVGSVETVPIDVRIIAATNRDLAAEASRGKFRDDLYYRLAVLSIPVPPLRERQVDIETIAQEILAEVRDDPRVELSREALDCLRDHAWPGNVRELRNVLVRSVAMRRSDVLQASDVAIDDYRSTDGVLSQRVFDAEKLAVAQALEVCGGNQTRAAKRLGISRRTLIYKLEKYGLKPAPKKKSSPPGP